MAIGEKVLASLENSYGDYCVDIFLRTDALAQAKAQVPWLKTA